MKRLLLLTAMLSFVSCRGTDHAASKRRIDYVNNFVGTSFTGHTFPGVCQPFGMIQPGPDTGSSDWEHCSGYVWEDSTVMGFSQTHLNGAGCMSCGDILIQPFTGESRESYVSKFEKSTEKANPGYYGVRLAELGVQVDITASQKVAFYKFTYDNGSANLFIDTQHGIVRPERLEKRAIEATFEFEDEYTLSGYVYAREWSRKKVFFVVKFDTPYRSHKVLPGRSAQEQGTRAEITFELSEGRQVQAKVAISSTGVKGAKKNLAADSNGWDFGAAREAAEQQWERQLSLFDAGGTEEEKHVFYTALYRVFLQPCDMSDTDGGFRGADDKIACLPGNRPYYTNLSIWDTFRAIHPLYTIVSPEIVDDVVNSMLDHHEKTGYLPIWPLWGQETYCMIANHAIPIIVEAYNKGFRGFDAERAYKAIYETSFVEWPENRKSPWGIYEKYGYYPMDMVKAESVSRTLETAYDDYCGAQMALWLGKEADYKKFTDRSEYYKNLFDTTSGFFRGRKSDGSWETPFDPLNVCHGSNGKGSFTEGNGWQYLWHVLHDTPAFIELLGGEERFMQRLDSLFTMESVVYGDGRVAAITGMIGQYAHGNEPGHHTAYLWSYTSKPWRAAELIREIVRTKYLNKPDGVCGNEDLGEMSAWYLFSVMGFYPVDPISGRYIFGAPQLPQVTINLPSGKKFTVRADNLSQENLYVGRITLNGKSYTENYIRHEDITAGGELVFEMTDKKSDIYL